MMCPEGLELKKMADETGSQPAKDKLTAHIHMCEIYGRETSKEPEVD
jgi:hypothetical protein